MLGNFTPAVAVGQIWHVCDPRQERFVKVIQIVGDRALIAQASRHVDCWKTMDGARWAQLKRFNGRRGGYEFVEDAS